jgi:putative membrane-bound dehydrogenase-like protein
MVLRSALFSFLSALSATAGQLDERMDPVVPEILIPPSPFLSADEALRSFTLAPGFVIEAVASEPMVEKPVCLDFDSAGRMWICEMRGYMPDIAGQGESVPLGRIVILEDMDGDGKADKRTVFLDDLLLPRAVSVFEDGVLFLDQERLCWIARTGDKPAGDPTVIPFDLIHTGNVEHKPNGLLRNLDNRIYMAKADQRLRRTGNGWLLEPTTFRGQWGIARDDFGTLYHNNNSTLLFADLLAPNLLMGNPGVRMKAREVVQLGRNRVWPGRVTPGVNRGYMSIAHGYDSNMLDPETFKLVATTAASGMTIYRGTNFPAEWTGTAFVTEPVCNLVKAIRISEKDGEPQGGHPLGKSEFLTSTDERFRPVNAFNAPDGSLYIVDMYHGIIQHETYMTPYLRKQTLDRGLESPGLEGGRIWRIRAQGHPLEKPMDLSTMDVPALVKSLASPNVWQREMAQRLLVERKDPAAVSWLAAMADDGERIARIHAIWTLEGMGGLKPEHLVASIRAKNAKLQASALWAATRLTPAELASLEPTLIALVPASAEVNPYLARVLGALGTSAGFGRLAELLGDSKDGAFVREAAVSGLDHHELEFRDAHLAENGDTQLAAWLTAGSKEKQPRSAPESKLEDEDLAAFRRGKEMFHGQAACFGCHGADGAGMPNLGPPLDESGWVTGKPGILVKILLHGMTGPVEVDGQVYHPSAEMPGLAANPAISDRMIADITTYIRNEWSNRAAPVPEPLVARQREVSQDRGGRPMTAAELKP